MEQLKLGKKMVHKKEILCILLYLISWLSFSQNTVTGIVSDSNGLLPGVNVLVKGTSNGTQTNFDGIYTLNNVDEKAVLIFSYIGFKSKEIVAGGQTRINVILEEDTQSLEQVIVVGYGTASKSDLTGSLSSVSSKDFEEQPITRIDEALLGRAAGVQVTQTSGAPGGNFKIRIRGANSISGSNEPLYVVDGIIVGSISAINVNDISSMEILKDASATAIYGSRGANGVVLITTKKGRDGPAKIEVEIFSGLSNVSQKLDIMTPAEFAEGVNFAEDDEIFTADEIADLRNGGGEDWQERLFRAGFFNSSQLSISGGSEEMDYFVSGNHFQSEGTIVDQEYLRYSLRVNLNANLTDKTKIGLNTFLTRENFDGTRADLSTGLTYDLTTPAFDEDGNYNFTPSKPGIGNGSLNPLLVPENSIREDFEDRLNISGYVSYKILDNLELNISGGLDRQNQSDNRYTPILINNIGVASVSKREVTRLQNTNRLTLSLNKNPDHDFKMDLVHEQQLLTNEFTQARARGFISDQTTFRDLQAGEIQQTQNRFTDESIQSFLGRANYSLFDKFLFTASMRADGSSKFRKGNRWGYFPSGSFAYKLSEENFIKNLSTINTLKLRASYGVTGSQAIAPLATRSLSIIDADINYPFTGDAFFVGVAPSNRLENPDLTWETTKQFNVAMDLGLWNSAFTLSVDYYKKNTDDLLLSETLPFFGGPTVVTRNVGEVENKGFDITLGLRLVSNNDWNISSTLTVSHNKNEVLSLVEGNEPIEIVDAFSGNRSFNNSFPVNPTRIEVGQPISSFRGYIFEGVYQLGEEEEAAVFGRAPGDAKYRDINGDNAITADDITTVGSGIPDFTWGWNWDISYRSWNLNFILLGSQGNDIYNFQRGRMMGLGAQQFHAVHADYNNRWTPSNPSNIPSRRDTTEFLSTQFLEDGSYVSLRNIALSYNFDKGIIQRLGIDNLKLYTSAENLFIITDYSGFDPISTATGNSDIDVGIDFNAYPLSRKFTLGFNVAF
ncbi:SusC/RagA family TonB-linked outer membrane protein [Aquimarina aggregata]|uniref:SusC/RagA family TonB-linked outer membrane protein n=1 Tax=Aquimarina aggregata TaxID=1642818 RepID=UPI00248FEFCD|nr:TonB-dependent receptor [Aquimarina aggregata]